MAPPSTGTCSPWAEVGDVCAPCNAYDFDEAVLIEGLQMASDVLFEFTNRRWPGLCSDVIRPCGYRCADSCGCYDCRQCGCRRLSEYELPAQPVASVEQVKIDGVVVDPARYRVDDHRWLVYLPESASADRQGWPCCQRIDLADTEPDTWSVTYTFGQEPPLAGVRAAATLGCQLALACSDDDDLLEQCQLPERIKTVVRQGLTLGAIDPLDLFVKGQTGLGSIDLWLGSLRYGAANRRAHVFVPGQGPTARHVDT